MTPTPQRVAMKPFLFTRFRKVESMLRLVSRSLASLMLFLSLVFGPVAMPRANAGKRHRCVRCCIIYKPKKRKRCCCVQHSFAREQRVATQPASRCIGDHCSKPEPTITIGR